MTPPYPPAIQELRNAVIDRVEHVLSAAHRVAEARAALDRAEQDLRTTRQTHTQAVNALANYAAAPPAPFDK